MSWNKFESDEKSYIFKSNIEGEVVTFLLSDFQVVWEEKCLIDEVLTRARQLNKRIEYDKETIIKTITSSPSQLSFSNNKETEESIEPPENELNLKYYLCNRPFNFKWILKLCNQEKFTRLITKPLLLSLSSLSKQNDELKRIINKKDIEIEQYKLEGATLKRCKLETEPFSLEKFTERIDFKPIDEFIKFADGKYEEYKKDVDNGGLLNTTTHQIASTSSGTSKKMEKYLKGSRMNYRKHIFDVEQQLQSRDVKQSFDDSDSCTPPAINDIAEIEKSLEELKRLQQEDLKLSSEPIKKKKLSRKELNL